MAVAAATTAGAVWLVVGRTGDASLGLYAVTAGAAAVGALIPDIDHPHALLSKRIPLGLFAAGTMVLGLVSLGGHMVSRQGSDTLGSVMITPMVEAARPFIAWAWVLVLMAILLPAASSVASSVLGHRGPAHSLAAAAMVTVVACLGLALAGQPWSLGLVVGWGFLSHLIADATTKMGLPALLWPWGSYELRRPGSQLTPPVAASPDAPEHSSSLQAPSAEAHPDARQPTSLTAPGLRSVAQLALIGIALATAIGISFVLLQGVTRPGVGTPPPAAAEAYPAPDIQLAKQRLLETNPDIYGKISNPDTPKVEVAESYITYEWTAVEQRGPASVQIKPASITLDSSGQVSGFSW